MGAGDNYFLLRDCLPGEETLAADAVAKRRREGRGAFTMVGSREGAGRWLGADTQYWVLLWAL